MMRLCTIIVALAFNIALATNLGLRQSCNEDNCFRAVWGDGNRREIIRAAKDCEKYLTTTVIVYPV